MNWTRRTTIASQRLQKQKDSLALQLLRMREQLETAERYRIGMEVVMSARLERIDKLTAQIDQLRRQNQKLDAECERLVEMVKLEPPADAAMLAPKQA